MIVWRIDFSFISCVLRSNTPLTVVREEKITKIKGKICLYILYVIVIALKGGLYLWSNFRKKKIMKRYPIFSLIFLGTFSNLVTNNLLSD